MELSDTLKLWLRPSSVLSEEPGDIKLPDYVLRILRDWHERALSLEYDHQSLMGYTFVLESILRRAEIELPIRPSCLDHATEDD